MMICDEGSYITIRINWSIVGDLRCGGLIFYFWNQKVSQTEGSDAFVNLVHSKYKP